MDYSFVVKCAEAVIAIKWRGMADVTEIEALKASLRGVRATAEALSAVAAKVDASDSHTDVSGDDLDNLQRLSLANAIGAQALRGLVEMMLKRRGKLADANEEPAEPGSAGIDE